MTKEIHTVRDTGFTLSVTGILRAAAALALLVGLVGCSEATEKPSGLPSVERFTSPPVAVEGDSGLPSLAEMDYDLFEVPADPLLDENFSTLENWQSVGGEDTHNETFSQIRIPECSGGSALRLKPGFPAKGRHVRVEPYTKLIVCARIKPPRGVPFDRLEDLLCLLETGGRQKQSLRTITRDQIMVAHMEWEKKSGEGEWIDIFQIITPATKNLVVCANAYSSGLKGEDELLVDRILIRPITIREAACAHLIRVDGAFDPRTAPWVDLSVGQELRTSLVFAAPGCLRFPVAPGRERIFRVGLILPAATCGEHSRRVVASVALARGEDGEVLLLQETMDLQDPHFTASAWIDRRVKVPPLDETARLVLRCESGDGRPALVAWGAPALCSPAEPGAPPNVILVSLDTLRADRLGAYGGFHPEGVSPFMDRLAKESVLFENAVTQAPFTLPSHVSMMSGQYPTVHRVEKTNTCIDRARTPLLASAFRGSGYVTGAFTGGHLLHHTFGFHEGFDTYFEGDPFKDGNLDRVIEWMETNRALPFFLFVHTFVVHDYAWNDPEYLERFDPDCESRLHGSFRPHDWNERLERGGRSIEDDRRCVENRYAAGIRMADDALRDLVSALESMGSMENTMVVITSDHGEEMLERGRFGHLGTLYEELLHVPLLLRPPGGVPPRRVADLVELIDVAPTILDAAGIPLPPSVQGRSLMGYLDASSRTPAKPMVFSEVDFDFRRSTVRTKDWKVIHSVANGQRKYELYNLASDPGEERDLAAESAAFKGMKERLNAYRKNLKALSDSLKGSGDQAADIDPGLMDALRAQGYVK